MERCGRSTRQDLRAEKLALSETDRFETAQSLDQSRNRQLARCRPNGEDDGALAFQNRKKLGTNLPQRLRIRLASAIILLN
jgi:hypothetical protein